MIGVAAGDDAPCTIDIDEQSAAGAKGTFECDNAAGTGSSGATYLDGIKVKGSFDARTR